jgi:hypothetical protein
LTALTIQKTESNCIVWEAVKGAILDFLFNQNWARDYWMELEPIRIDRRFWFAKVEKTDPSIFPVLAICYYLVWDAQERKAINCQRTTTDTLDWPFGQTIVLRENSSATSVSSFDIHLNHVPIETWYLPPGNEELEVIQIFLLPFFHVDVAHLIVTFLLGDLNIICWEPIKRMFR